MTTATPTRHRDSGARLIVGLSLLLLCAGTLRGQAPPWPHPATYAVLAAAVGVLWLATALMDSDRLDRIAAASLVALALERAGGYGTSWWIDPTGGNLAAVAAWSIVAGLLFHHPPPSTEAPRCPP